MMGAGSTDRFRGRLSIYDIRLYGFDQKSRNPQWWNHCKKKDICPSSARPRSLDTVFQRKAKFNKTILMEGLRDDGDF